MPEVNLKKLADILGLSISTVSRALKGHPDVSDDTKRKVQELSDLLEYEPNTYAINLKTNSSKELGVIIPTICNDFYQSFISELERKARVSGFSLIIHQTGDDSDTELEHLKRCGVNRMAGVFVSLSTGTTDISKFLKFDADKMPIIFFDKVPGFEACNKVRIDDEAAARLAAGILIQKDKGNILAIFGNEKLSITTKRCSVFYSCFLNNGTEDRVESCFASSTDTAYQCAISQLYVSNRFDAVFCMSDEILIGVMRAIQTLGLNVPTDISVLAISDGNIPTFYYPTVTYIETSGAKLAQVAFLRMLSCLNGSKYAQELKIDPGIVSGGSI